MTSEQWNFYKDVIGMISDIVIPILIFWGTFVIQRRLSWNAKKIDVLIDTWQKINNYTNIILSSEEESESITDAILLIGFFRKNGIFYSKNLHEKLNRVVREHGEYLVMGNPWKNHQGFVKLQNTNGWWWDETNENKKKRTEKRVVIDCLIEDIRKIIYKSI